MEIVRSGRDVYGGKEIGQLADQAIAAQARPDAELVGKKRFA